MWDQKPPFAKTAGADSTPWIPPVDVSINFPWCPSRLGCRETPRCIAKGFQDGIGVQDLHGEDAFQDVGSRIVKSQMANEETSYMNVMYEEYMIIISIIITMIVFDDI